MSNEFKRVQINVEYNANKCIPEGDFISVIYKMLYDKFLHGEIKDMDYEVEVKTGE